jgi:hypothetical protein
MAYRGAIGVSVLVAAVLTTIAASRAFDETKYPDLKGHLRRWRCSSDRALHSPGD